MKARRIIFPIVTPWVLFVAMENRVLIRPGPKPNATFPKFDCNWLTTSSCGDICISKYERADGRTAGLLYCKLTFQTEQIIDRKMTLAKFVSNLGGLNSVRKKIINTCKISATYLYHRVSARD